MKIFLSVILGLLTFTTVIPKPSLAAESDQCSFETNPPADTWNSEMDYKNISIRIGAALAPKTKYYVVYRKYNDTFKNIRIGEGIANDQGIIDSSDPSFKSNYDKGVLRDYMVAPGTHSIVIFEGPGTNSKIICSKTYKIPYFETLKCTIEANKTDKSYGPGEKVSFKGKFSIEKWDKTQISYANKNISVQLLNKKGDRTGDYYDNNITTDSNGNFEISDSDKIKTPAITNNDIGWWKLKADEKDDIGKNRSKEACYADIYVSKNPNEPVSGSPPTGDGGKNPCISGTCQTALGPIKTDPAEFIKTILGIAIGLAGGIALIFMVIGAIRVLISSGDQQKLTGGKDMIVAAVSGLLFLILSVLILRFIGTGLLGGVPGL